MKAITYEKYGTADVLKMTDVEKPVPAEDEVLVRVRAASVVFADYAFLTGSPFLIRFMQGLFKPKKKILGGEFAGVVEAVGPGATQFQPGDEVYGDLADFGFGAFAEYAAVPQKATALKPANLSFEQAAAVPQSAVVALQGLRDKADVQPGQKVLILGASGGIGTFAVQIAKHLGAIVTGVCSTRNLDLVRSLGADEVIDYTKEDFSRHEGRYDVIFSIAGYHSAADFARALTDDGVYVGSNGSLAQIMQITLMAPWVTRGSQKKMSSMLQRPSQEDLITLKDWIEAGAITPVIGECYPFSETAEALRHYGLGRTYGKVVISME